MRQTIAITLALLFGAMLMLGAGLAHAKEITANVSWDQNPLDQKVDKYTVNATTSTGKTYTDDSLGDPPDNKLSMVIDEPIGTKLDFTVKACSGAECSLESDPVSIIMPADALTVPTGLGIELVKP